MYEQNENINKRIEIIKRKQIEILVLNSTVTEMKTLEDGLTSDLNRQKK